MRIWNQNEKHSCANPKYHRIKLNILALLPNLGSSDFGWPRAESLKYQGPLSRSFDFTIEFTYREKVKCEYANWNEFKSYTRSKHRWVPCHWTQLRFDLLHLKKYSCYMGTVAASCLQTPETRKADQSRLEQNRFGKSCWREPRWKRNPRGTIEIDTCIGLANNQLTLRIESLSNFMT